MKLGVGLKVGTSLSLTPQLQQAIKMLQLSNLELAQEIDNAILENPLLEKATEQEPTDSQNTVAETIQSNDVIDVHTQVSDTHLQNDLAIDTKWEDVYIHESTKWDRPTAIDTDYQGQTTDTLQSHLQWQMNLVKLSPIDQYICDALIDSINDKGLLTTNIEDIHQSICEEISFTGVEYDLELSEVEVVLKRLQQCEPIGVAARNLAESLQLQLTAFYKQDSLYEAAFSLLTHHDCLVKNDIKKLTQYTKLTLEQIHEAMELIRTLNPYPAESFNHQEVDYQIPDVIVKKVSDVWQVQLNPDTLPKLRVNQSYAQLVQKGKKDKANDYIKNNLVNAKQFIRSIDERNNSLLKVASAIVEKQYEFFEQGVTALKPLILKEIAEMVDLHESTVSRITTNKYMLTSTGLYDLKFFFSSKVGNSNCETSSTVICAKIKEFIEAENTKKPLSDSAICKLLQNEGFDVARRTVAKYRESLGYPSSTQRKRLI